MTDRRILVIANETVGDSALRDEIRARANVGAEVFVVCPALNSRLRHWFSDEDGARARAEARLRALLTDLAGEGVSAQGSIGNADPYVAFRDALALYRPTEVVISTHPPGRSNWLERDLIGRARRAVSVPLAHVVARDGAAPLQHAASV